MTPELPHQNENVFSKPNTLFFEHVQPISTPTSAESKICCKPCHVQHIGASVAAFALWQGTIAVLKTSQNIARHITKHRQNEKHPKTYHKTKAWSWASAQFMVPIHLFSAKLNQFICQANLHPQDHKKT